MIKNVKPLVISLLAVLTFGLVNFVNAQCFNINPSIPDSICSGQTLVASGIDSNYSSYRWRFGLPSVSAITTPFDFGNPSNSLGANTFGFNIIEANGNYYGFVKKSNAQTLYRYDFGTSLSNNPTVNLVYVPPFTGSSGLTDDDIDIIKIGNQWFGFTPLRTGNAIIKYSFGTDIENDSVTVTSLGNPSNQIALPFALKAQLYNDSLFIAIANFSGNTIVLYNFGNNFNTPVWHKTINLASLGLSATSGIETYFNCEERVVFCSGFTSNNVFRINFGNSFNNTPTIQSISATATSSPCALRLKTDMGYPELFVKNKVGSQNLTRFSFKDSITQPVNTILKQSLPQFGSSMLGFGADVEYTSSGFYFFVVTDASSLRRSFTPNADVGGNSQSNLFTPNFTPTIASTIGYSLNIETSNGNKFFLQDSLKIKQSPQITASISSFCFGDTTYFSGLQTTNLSPLLWSWNFGSINDTALGVNVQKLYSDTGSYAIKTKADFNGCVDSVATNINILALPFANFSVDTSCQGEILSINNNSSIYYLDTNVTYTWQFENDSVFAEYPQFSFDSNGTKSISLFLESSNGCNDSHTDSVYIKPAPIANFSVSNTCFGESTSFLNLSGTSASYTSSWSFGDGATSLLESPSHIYSDTGLYQIQLVTISNNGCADSTIQAVYISPSPNPVFSLGTQPFCANTSVFINENTQSAHPILSKTLIIGSDTFSLPLPELTLSESGLLSGAFKVVVGSSCSVDSSFQININQQPLLSYGLNKLCESESSLFNGMALTTDNQTLNPLEWTFSDGTIFTGDSIEKSFPEYGIIGLTIQSTTDSGCVGEIQDSIYIFKRPEINLSFDNPLCSGTILSNSSTTEFDENDSIFSSLWTMQDLAGNTLIFTSGEELISSSYGETQVSVFVISQNGCSNSDSIYLNLNESPKVELVPDSICEGSLVTLSANYSGSNYAYLWNFEEGDISTNSSTNRLFTDPGYSSFSLEITDKLSKCKGLDTVSYYVGESVRVKIMDSMFCPEVKNEVSLSIKLDSLDSITAYSWRVNGEVFSDSESLTFRPALNQNNVLVEVKSFLGCTSTNSKTILSKEKPNAALELNSTFGVVPLQVAASSLFEQNQYLWLFNEDTIGLAKDLFFEIGSSGVFPLTLFVKDDLGCSSSESAIISVFEGIIDLGINSIELTNSDTTIISSEIQNLGNVPVFGFDLEYRFFNGLTILQRINDTILPGEQLLVKSERMSINHETVNGFCATITELLRLSDENLTNNKTCLAFNGMFNPYPNPTNQSITVPFSSANDGELKIFLLDPLGQSILQTIWTVMEGYNEYLLNLETLPCGLYILEIQFENSSEQYKIIKS